MIKCKHAAKFKRELNQEEATQFKKNKGMMSNHKDLRLTISMRKWILPAQKAFWSSMIKDHLQLRKFSRKKT